MSPAVGISLRFVFIVDSWWKDLIFHRTRHYAVSLCLDENASDEEHGKRKIVDFKHLKHVPDFLSSLGFFVGFLRLCVFYHYIQFYAIEIAGTNPDPFYFYLLTILKAGSFLGHLPPNHIGRVPGTPERPDHFWCYVRNLVVPHACDQGSSGVIANTTIHWFVSGLFVSLPNPVVASVSSDKSLLGIRLSVSFAFWLVSLRWAPSWETTPTRTSADWCSGVESCWWHHPWFLIGARYIKVELLFLARAR